MSDNQKFSALPREKQLKIINAGLECFGKYGYKNANTEEIACKAGISKGLLFYYFKNKERFYLYLCEFCQEVMLSSIDREEFSRITDFFELIDYGAKVKLNIVAQYPFITDFAVRIFSCRKDEGNSSANAYISRILEDSFDLYFRNIDLTPFREDANPRQIYRMLLWLAEGYLLEKQRMNTPIEVEEMIQEFGKWKEMFRKISYREEYV